MRSFVVRFIVLAALITPLWPLTLSAQVEPVGVVTDVPNEVFRRYTVPESDVGPVFDGKAMSLYSYGYVADSDKDARNEYQLMGSTGLEMFESIAEDTEIDSGVNISLAGHEEVEFVDLGEESRAFVFPSTYGRMDVEFGIALIRDGAWIQMLTAVAFNDDGQTVQLLEEVASFTKGRWPNDTIVKVRPDGIRHGGIWGLAPLPDDVPGHLVLDKSYDEGPGPSTAPVSAEPTLASTSIASASTQASEPATRTTDSGEQNSRLAQPFDATIRIILANETFSVEGQGQCVGQGRYSSLHEEGLVALKTIDGGEELVLVRGFQPGHVSYDLQLQADVCVFEIGFRDVHPRAGYLLIAGDAPITRFTYEELSAGNVVEVVVEH